VPIALAALLVSGCGGGGHERRDAVDAYIAAANSAQTKHLPALRTVDDAFRAYSRGGSGAATLHRLAGASAAIDATRTSLQRLHPPAEAKTVQRDLLRLYRLEATLAGEVHDLAVYLPAATRTLGRLAPANAALGKAVHPGIGAAAEARALDAYAAQARTLRTRLTALSPPRMLRPWHDEEAGWLAALTRDAGRLADDLRSHAAATGTAAAAFRSDTARTPGVSRAQRQAVRAYDDRIDAIGKLSTRIRRELQQLDRRLT
jgi:hypothetical protein